MKSERIRALNDVFRTTFRGGQVMLTAGVAALPDLIRVAALRKVAAFSDFSEENDPHGEHDFGRFEVESHTFFWKIDYHDKVLEYGSEDPSDPDKTTRVLTVMLAEEY